jgi:uncharacterized protein (TIGR00159 family)
MTELLHNLFLSVTIFDFIDIAIITLVIYKLLIFMKGTRGVYMVGSVVGIAVLLLISSRLGLRTTNWILSNVTGYLFIMLVILFQPELRRALSVLGESRFFVKITTPDTSHKMLEEIVRAATILANRQIGALIVIQRKIDLIPFVTLGQKLDSEVTRELLQSIFIPYSPMHDGAVLINNGRLSYAGCILPLTKREDILQDYGTRHRAAIGITEETDAVVVVVSEERGAIAVVSGGMISTELDAMGLESSLKGALGMEDKV